MKAGNINNALKQIDSFEYFSISDADSILPKSYITGLLPYFKDKQIAFMQARQESNPEQKSTFAQHLGYQVSLHCDYYMKTKNRYGHMMFYGHAAILRTDVYHEAGGFPEIATEDRAYSMLIRAKGYVGKNASEHPDHSPIQSRIPRYHNFIFYQQIFPIEQKNACKTRRFALS
ncbi:MAG: glycosyltransferase [Candidatus Omnitrophica bacterium]|nr:glycosyltransferase [Candidatus Omnitrophota bacterium]